MSIKHHDEVKLKLLFQNVFYELNKMWILNKKNLNLGIVFMFFWCYIIKRCHIKTVSMTNK